MDPAAQNRAHPKVKGSAYGPRLHFSSPDRSVAPTLATCSSVVTTPAWAQHVVQTLRGLLLCGCAAISSGMSSYQLPRTPLAPISASMQSFRLPNAPTAAPTMLQKERICRDRQLHRTADKLTYQAISETQAISSTRQLTLASTHSNC